MSQRLLLLHGAYLAALLGVTAWLGVWAELLWVFMLVGLPVLVGGVALINWSGGAATRDAWRLNKPDRDG